MSEKGTLLGGGWPNFLSGCLASSCVVYSRWTLAIGSFMSGTYMTYTDDYSFIIEDTLRARSRRGPDTELPGPGRFSDIILVH